MINQIPQNGTMTGLAMQQPTENNAMDYQANVPAISSEDQTHHPNGLVKVKLPFELSAQQFPRAVQPLCIYLCPYCIKKSSAKECMLTQSGKVLLNIHMCKRCVDVNYGMQQTVAQIQHRHMEEAKAIWTGQNN